MSAVTRSRIGFSPSPGPLTMFNPADEGTPPRARRHQHRRSEEHHSTHRSASDGSTAQSLLLTSSRSKINQSTSPTVPLKEKNVAAPSKQNLPDDRDSASPDKPTPIIAAKRVSRTPKRAESTAELSDPKSTSELASIINTSGLTEKSAMRKINTRASKANAKLTTPLIDTIEQQPVRSSYPRTSRPSSKVMVEVVIETPVRLKSKATPEIKENKVIPASKMTSEDEDKVLEDPQPDPKTLSKRKGKNSAKDRISSKTVTTETAVTSDYIRKQRGKGVATRKSIILTSRIGNAKDTFGEGTTHKEAIRPDKPQTILEEVGQVDRMKASDQVEQPPAPDVGQLFDVGNDDAPDMCDNIPPSSPGRFASWHQNAPVSSDDDLEYVDQNQYSDHRQQEEGKGLKGRVSVGRLGADIAVPAASQEREDDKDAFPLLKSLAEDTSNTTQVPMHSTPLKHKSKEQAGVPKPLDDSPITAERKIKARERMYGLGSDEESENDLFVVSVNKGESEKTRSVIAFKKEKVIKEQRNVQKEAKKFTPGKVQTSTKTKAQSAISNNKMTEIAEPAESTMADKEKKIERKEGSSMATVNGVKAAHNSLQVAEDVEDMFGFKTSQRKIKELLTEKAKQKKSGQIHLIKEADINTQTQNDSHLSFAFEFNKSISGPVINEQEIFPAVLDFTSIRDTAQKEVVDKTVEKKGSLSDKFSPELTKLDPDLEDDILEDFIHQRRKGNAKMKQSSVDIQVEEKQMTIKEILALAAGTDQILEKHTTKSSTIKKDKKPIGKGRKLQLSDQEENKGKTPKPKKAKVLKLTQDESAIAPTRARSGINKGGKTAAGSVPVVEFDDYDVPPGMTSADVINSRNGKKRKNQVKERAEKKNEVEANTPTITKSRPRPRPSARTAMTPIDGEEWNQLPKAGARSIISKRVTKLVQKQGNIATQDSQTIITPASRKNLKRARLSKNDDEEDEENEDPKISRQRQNYDSLNDYELAVEKV